MASHGKKRHTKRIAAPKIISIPRKKHIWIKSTTPGAHPKDNSLPLLILLRDLLKICSTAREAKRLITNGQVKIDGRQIKDIAFQVGLMDVVTLGGLGSFVILNKNGKLLPFKTQHSDSKLCKVTGKHIVKKGKVQLALHDGKTLMVTEGAKYSPGDTVKISLEKHAILEHLKLEKGSTCYVFKGRHAGATGTLKEVTVFSGITPSNAIISDEKGHEVITLKDYVFVVDKEFKA